jgi:hypothetical protein
MGAGAIKQEKKIDIDTKAIDFDVFKALIVEYDRLKASGDSVEGLMLFSLLFTYYYESKNISYLIFTFSRYIWEIMQIWRK